MDGAAAHRVFDISAQRLIHVRGDVEHPVLVEVEDLWGAKHAQAIGLAPLTIYLHSHGGSFHSPTQLHH